MPHGLAAPWSRLQCSRRSARLLQVVGGAYKALQGNTAPNHCNIIFCQVLSFFVFPAFACVSVVKGSTGLHKALLAFTRLDLVLRAAGGFTRQYSGDDISIIFGMLLEVFNSVNPNHIERITSAQIPVQCLLQNSFIRLLCAI